MTVERLVFLLSVLGAPRGPQAAAPRFIQTCPAAILGTRAAPPSRWRVQM